MQLNMQLIMKMKSKWKMKNIVVEYWWTLSRYDMKRKLRDVWIKKYYLSSTKERNEKDKDRIHEDTKFRNCEWNKVEVNLSKMK